MSTSDPLAAALNELERLDPSNEVLARIKSRLVARTMNDVQAKQFLPEPSGNLGNIKLYTQADLLKAIKRAGARHGNY